MYKFLLCWRYLRTRYIALASIISVMLGVATMIVVNSVMSGFTSEMQNRIHGILSDITFESNGLEGMPDAAAHMQKINEVAGDSIEGMTATVTVPAMLSFQCNGRWITQQVQLVGIDERTHSQVSDFGKYLQHEENRKEMSFELREGGYDTRDHQADPDAPLRPQMQDAGWVHRRRVARAEAFRQPAAISADTPDDLLGGVPPSALVAEANGSQLQSPRRLPRLMEPADSAAATIAEAATPPLPADLVTDGPADSAQAGGAPAVSLADPFAGQPASGKSDMATEPYTGAVLGIALVSIRNSAGEDRFLALPGNDVKLTFPTAGTPPKVVSDTFTIVDLYESKMSEYDSSFVFVPIRSLQEDRGMFQYVGGTKQYFVNSIQIKLKPGVDGVEIRDRLRAAFPPEYYGVFTWRDKQGPLLAAVQMETAILNVLLFLIIAVAGFGILAIFLMIVVEKTRDIGILKSLGASAGGVMGIFLAYGLSLGLVGSGVGLVLGLLFVKWINEIAGVLGWITGRPVFDPSIYYFYEIPAIIDPVTIGWIMCGAVAIAVLASILPAARAALLHPVEALRHE